MSSVSPKMKQSKPNPSLAGDQDESKLKSDALKAQKNGAKEKKPISPEFRSALARIKILERKHSLIAGKLKKINPKDLGDRILRLINADAKHLHKQLSIMISKNCVSTEVFRYVRKAGIVQPGPMWTAMTEILDMEDSWWVKNEKLTIGEWAKIVVDIAQEKAKLQKRGRQ